MQAILGLDREEMVQFMAHRKEEILKRYGVD